MLSNVEDSYYAKTNPKEPQKLWSDVCRDIEQAAAKRAVGPSSFTINPLWKGAAVGVISTPEPAPFLKELDTAKHEASSTKRLVLAYRKMVLILDAVRDAWQRTLAKEAFYFDLSPDNLRVTSNQIRAATANYGNEEQYLRALLVGEMDGTQGVFGSDVFTPPCLRFLSRAATATISEAGSEQATLNISYSDSYPLWSGVRPGDYVRVSDNNQTAQLFRIVSVSNADVKVTHVPLGRSISAAAAGPTSPQTPVRPSAGKALLIRGVRPAEYYLSMCGIYLHHLFFAGDLVEERDSGAIPSAVWMIEQARCSGFLTSRLVGDRRQSVIEDDIGKPLTGRSLNSGLIEDRLAKLYLWLVCRDFIHDGEWGEVLPDKGSNEAFAKVRRCLNLVRDGIAQLVGVSGGEYLDGPAEAALLSELKPDPKRVGKPSSLESVLRRTLKGKLEFA